MQDQDEAECPICFENIKSNFFQNDGLHLPCGHNFHNSCVTSWFSKCKATVCPICRQCATESDALKYEIRALVDHWMMKFSQKHTYTLDQKCDAILKWCLEEIQIHDRYTRVRSTINAGLAAELLPWVESYLLEWTY